MYVHVHVRVRVRECISGTKATTSSCLTGRAGLCAVCVQGMNRPYYIYPCLINTQIGSQFTDTFHLGVYVLRTSSALETVTVCIVLTKTY